MINLIVSSINSLIRYIFTSNTKKDKLCIIDDIPEDLQKDINKITNKYTKYINIYKSLYYLLRDTTYIGLVIILTNYLLNYYDYKLLFIPYSIIQGTVSIGLWVLAHECGHQAFSKSRLINDSLGFVLHSSLLVPYFSWKYTHNIHHKYTNHIIKGEVFTPHIVKNKNLDDNNHSIIGEDAFSIIRISTHLFMGWPLYLFTNAGGIKVQSDLKTRIDKNKYKDHFHSKSQIMDPSLGYLVELSTLGCLSTLGLLIYYLRQKIFFWYIGPYIIVNAWLIIYTWLHHTHVDVPHYGSDKFTFLKGALSTIDRKYPDIINHLHHNIGSTHVAHHINYHIPHYAAVEATKDIKKLLGKYYLYDDTPIYKALFSTSKYCVYIEDINGVQYYKH